MACRWRKAPIEPTTLGRTRENIRAAREVERHAAAFGGEHINPSGLDATLRGACSRPSRDRNQ
jgi:hypothetical protein